MDCADVNKDGLLDYMEFTERFHQPAESIGMYIISYSPSFSPSVPPSLRPSLPPILSLSFPPSLSPSLPPDPFFLPLSPSQLTSLLHLPPSLLPFQASICVCC